jgi:hypothetical protein
MSEGTSTFVPNSKRPPGLSSSTLDLLGELGDLLTVPIADLANFPLHLAL